MPYDKGFRVFNLKWVVSSPSIEGSSYENDDPTSGKVINSNGTFGYTDDKYGVKRCLEDFCSPLFSQELNGEGWELDTDLCPDRHAILLKPNVRVFVLFFRHTTGARLMLGLNYFGMVSSNMDPSPDPPVYSSTSDGYRDVGFFASKTVYNSSDQPPNSTNPTLFGGGLFMSMIPPAKSGEPQDIFHPEISIRDIAFYPQTMTPVQYMKSNLRETRVVYSYSYLAPSTSFIKQGTSDSSEDNAVNHSGSKVYGAVIGRTISLSLIVCEEIVGFRGKYNNLGLGKHLCGRLLSDCRQPEDNLSTAEYALFVKSGSGDYTSDKWKSYLWQPSYSQLVYSKCCNVTGSNWVGMCVDYNTNGYLSGGGNYEYLYAGFALGSGMISTNSKTKSKLRPDLFRFVSSTSDKIEGQTYNDNEWCYYGTVSMPYTGSSGWYNTDTSSGLMIKWDGQFNGSETFG